MHPFTVLFQLTLCPISPLLSLGMHGIGAAMFRPSFLLKFLFAPAARLSTLCI